MIPVKKNQTGLSIIELIITTSIISIMFVVISDFMINGLNSQRYISEQNDAVVEIRKALKQMTSEIRETTNADTGAYPLATVDEQELTFYSDIDNDTDTERIRYYLDGTDLIRSVTEPVGDPLVYTFEQEPTILAHYITNDSAPLFYYYNEDYPADSINNPLSSPVDVTEVRMIEISIHVNIDPDHIPDYREMDVYIHLRNLKENF